MRKRSYSHFALARVVRFAVVVPSTALLLHRAQPEIPWSSWCGISGLTLLFCWFIDGSVAIVRWNARRRERLRLHCAADR